MDCSEIILLIHVVQDYTCFFYLEEVVVVFLEEESEAEVSRPWHDLLVSGNPGQLSPVARVQVLQKLSLVEVGSGWDYAISLPDHLVGSLGLHGQGVWALLEPVTKFIRVFSFSIQNRGK